MLPLQNLTKAKKLEWDEESEECFFEVKKVLSTLAIIMPPSWEQEFFGVGTDSIGALLLQKDTKISLMRPVYFASKVMKEAKKNYTHAEQMVLALKFATKHFCSYLLPCHFTIIMVEENFPYVLQHMYVSSRIAKWLIRLPKNLTTQ